MVRRILSRYENLITGVVSCIVLFPCLFLSLLKQGAAYAELATEENIRDAILERKQFSDEHLQQMDRNEDGQLDVTDLVNLLGTPPSTTAASFESATLAGSEGDGVVEVRVNFSTHFTGTLQYEIGGTAVAGVDYQIAGANYATLTGTLVANGLYVHIPIAITDDGELEDTAETVELTIYYEENAGLPYVPGAATECMVYIHDNDAIWNGAIETIGTSLHFQMKIIQEPSGASGALISDGYGIIPKNGTSKEWRATTMVFSETSFTATVEDILIPAPLTLTNVDFKRKFSFTADSSKPDHLIDPRSTIRGTVAESLTSDLEPQFNRPDIPGTFTLVRQISVIEPIQPILEDAPPELTVSPEQQKEDM